MAILSLAITSFSISAPISDPDNQHNLSSNATHGGPHSAPVLGGGTDRICIFCHTPHSARPQSPLWSRPDPATLSFPLYAQPLAIKGDLGAPGGAQSRSKYGDNYPNGASRMCLSCHDGSTAIGVLADNTSINMDGGENFVTGVAVIDLATSHPISFVYDNNVLNDVLAVHGIGTYQLPPNLSVPAPLDSDGKMQCTTCHDPHNDTSLDGGGLPPFWRHSSNPIVDEYDDVCNQCHLGGNPSGPSGDHDPGPGI